MRAAALNVTTLSFIFLWTQDHSLIALAFEAVWGLARHFQLNHTVNLYSVASVACRWRITSTVFTSSVLGIKFLG